MSAGSRPGGRDRYEPHRARHRDADPDVEIDVGDARGRASPVADRGLLLGGERDVARGHALARHPRCPCLARGLPRSAPLLGAAPCGGLGLLLCARAGRRPGVAAVSACGLSCSCAAAAAFLRRPGRACGGPSAGPPAAGSARGGATRAPPPPGLCWIVPQRLPVPPRAAPAPPPLPPPCDRASVEPAASASAATETNNVCLMFLSLAVRPAARRMLMNAPPGRVPRFQIVPDL